MSVIPCPTYQVDGLVPRTQLHNGTLLIDQFDRRDIARAASRRDLLLIAQRLHFAGHIQKTFLGRLQCGSSQPLQNICQGRPHIHKVRNFFARLHVNHWDFLQLRRLGEQQRPLNRTARLRF